MGTRILSNGTIVVEDDVTGQVRVRMGVFDEVDEMSEGRLFIYMDPVLHWEVPCAVQSLWNQVQELRNKYGTGSILYFWSRITNTWSMRTGDTGWRTCEAVPKEIELTQWLLGE